MINWEEILPSENEELPLSEFVFIRAHDKTIRECIKRLKKAEDDGIICRVPQQKEMNKISKQKED